MIKVKLFNPEEMLGAYTGESGRVVESQDYFEWHMLCPRFEKNPQAPFRDPESLRLLKESYDISFASDSDWYSVICEGSRMNIWCLNRGIKFALVALHCSRQGIYTWFEPAGDAVWKILADMPFDILVAMRTSNMGLRRPAINGAMYQIVNYPYGGRKIEVTVLHDLLCGKDGYTGVPESHKNGTGYGLCMGRDGKYYSDPLGVMYAFQYYWKNDIGGIIKYLDELGRDRGKPIGAVGTYDIFELGRILGQDENCIMNLEYLYCKNHCGQGGKDGCQCPEPCQENNPYEEYLYFRDKFKVISHLDRIPGKIYCRKLPMLIVDRNADGTYSIQGDLTVKNPKFHELFYDVISGRSPDRERTVLVVDVDELLDSAEDIKRAVCGFRVLSDSVEVFGREEAMEVFVGALKEAYYSGSCTVDGDFY